MSRATDCARADSLLARLDASLELEERDTEWLAGHLDACEVCGADGVLTDDLAEWMSVPEPEDEIRLAAQRRQILGDLGIAPERSAVAARPRSAVPMRRRFAAVAGAALAAGLALVLVSRDTTPDAVGPGSPSADGTTIATRSSRDAEVVMDEDLLDSEDAWLVAGPVWPSHSEMDIEGLTDEELREMAELLEPGQGWG